MLANEPQMDCQMNHALDAHENILVHTTFMHSHEYKFYFCGSVRFVTPSRLFRKSYTYIACFALCYLEVVHTAWMIIL